MTISEANRKYVRQRAKYLCEYCHSPEEISTSRFTIDHIKPRSLDGTDEVNNLALACSRCNQRRYNFTAGSDLVTQAEVAIFNPRSQEWQEHFIWTRDGIEIIGVTPIGRATCHRLDMNDERYQGERSIQEARALWIKAGCHPPPYDPRENQ